MALATAPALRAVSASQRQEAIVAQLTRIFGPAASAPTRYIEYDWATDLATAATHRDGDGDANETFGHPLSTEPLLGGRGVLAGAETADRSAGQMHGAVLAGTTAASRVIVS